MSRHITLDIQSFRLSVLFCIGENLVQRIIIQMIFQFVGKIGILRRFVLRSPGEIIIFLPFGLESFAVSATHPELRFLQIDGGDSGINDSFDLCFLHIADKTLGGYDIGNQMAVSDLISIAVALSFFQMPVYSVPLSQKIVLIVAPGNSGHKLRQIPFISP